MARELRNSQEYHNIYISPDRTPEEQRRDKEIRDEVKRRRANGESVEIRRGRIVPRMEATREEQPAPEVQATQEARTNAPNIPTGPGAHANIPTASVTQANIPPASGTHALSVDEVQNTQDGSGEHVTAAPANARAE